jgi:hypothetical protein
MSLKIFHICFISISALVCAGVAWWCVENDTARIYSVAFAAAAAVLPVYGAWFLKRTSKLVL